MTIGGDRPTQTAGLAREPARRRVHALPNSLPELTNRFIRSARRVTMRNRNALVFLRAHLAARPLAASGIPFSVPMGTRLPSA
jgi:hypothetical protein